MRGRRSVMAVLVAGVAAGAAAQTPPGYVRDGKVWFRVVEAGGKPFDDFTWGSPATGDDGCFRLADWAQGTGVRYGSFAKGAAGSGTFTLQACAAPASTDAAQPEPLVTIGDLRSMFALQGGTTVEIQRPESAESWITLEVSEPSGSFMPSVYFGGDYGQSDLQLDATGSSETFTLLRNGQMLEQEQGDTSAAELNDLFDLTYEEESAGFDFGAGIPMGPALLFINGRVQRTDALLLYDVPQPTAGVRTTEWSGRGKAFQVGLDFEVPLARSTFVEIGGRYGMLLETEVTRSPGLSASGGRVTEDRGELERKTFAAHAAIRREWGDRVAVWAGAEAGWETIRLDGTATAEFTQPNGLFEQRVEFTNEFESNAVRAFGGVDVRVAGPIYARASYVGSSSGSTYSVGLGAGKRHR